MIDVLNYLDVYATDIGNTYLNAPIPGKYLDYRWSRVW